MKRKKILMLSLAGTLTLSSCSTVSSAVISSTVSSAVSSTINSTIKGIKGIKEKIIYLDNIPPKEDAYKPKEKSIYEKEVQEKVVSLLKAPETPLRTPDVITRVLILPYTKEDGTLIMSHYVFAKIKEGKWILGNYLIDQPKEDSKIIKPLKETEQPDNTNQTPKNKNKSQLPQQPANSQQACPSGQCKNINESEAENVRQQMNQMKESMSNMHINQPNQQQQEQQEQYQQQELQNENME